MFYLENALHSCIVIKDLASGDSSEIDLKTLAHEDATRFPSFSFFLNPNKLKC